MTGWGRSLLGAAAIAAAVGACGDDGGADDDGEGERGAAGTSGSSASGQGAAGGAAEECEPVDACQQCGAASCPDERAACCATPGCPTIIACAREKNCNGTDCYKPETCQAVIDEHGGPIGDAVAAAAPLGECAAMSCPECPQPPGGAG
jgi:hypothetical protein